jgi:uncharacterized glyoxalase superfamily protein PhnB
MAVQTQTKPAKTASNAKGKPKAAAKRPTPQTVTPHLVCAGAAEAIAFYKKAFGAEEMMRLPGKDGKLMHAAVQIRGAMIMLVDEMPEWGALSPKSLKGTPVTIHLYVDDVDRFFARAVKAGATAKMPVTCSGATATASSSIRSGTVGRSPRPSARCRWRSCRRP